MKISCGRGAEDLGEYEKGIINRLSNEYFEKIKRGLKEVVISFDVHVKCFEKKGNVKRFSVDARLKSPGHEFEASVEEWKLADAVHKVLEKIMNEIEHKTHASDKSSSGFRKK